MSFIYRLREGKEEKGKKKINKGGEERGATLIPNKPGVGEERGAGFVSLAPTCVCRAVTAGEAAQDGGGQRGAVRGMRGDAGQGDAGRGPGGSGPGRRGAARRERHRRVGASRRQIALQCF